MGAGDAWEAEEVENCQKKNRGILGIESGTWQCSPDHQKERG